MIISPESVMVCILICLIKLTESLDVENKDMMEGKIVGGTLAYIDKYPHVAFLIITCVSHNDREKLGCGSSILNQHILLTAAHCLSDCIYGSAVKIVVGSEYKFRSLYNVTASGWLVHPQYNPRTVSNDLALVRAGTKLQYSNRLKRIILKRTPPSSSLADVAGWGEVNEVLHTSTYYLKMATQEILNEKHCKEMLKKIPKGTFCAIPVDQKHNSVYGYAALGDSGSGLVGSDHVLRGLVSYKNIKYETTIVVYTNVSYHYDWIAENTGKMYCP